MPYSFKTVIASGTLAAGNAKLSMIDATAFADSVGINLAQYVDGKAMLYLRNTTGGYEAFAFLGAVGTGETYGSELCSDPAFDTDASWTKQSGWTVSGGKGVASASGTGNLIYQSGRLSAPAGKLYKVTCDVVVTIGTVKLAISDARSSAISTSSTPSFYATGLTGTGIGCESGSTFTGTVDNYYGKQVLTPSTSGVTLKNLAGAQSFIYKHVSFNPNAEMLWRVVTDKKIYRIL